MSLAPPYCTLEIERLIAEADNALERKDARRLEQQANVISKITSLTAHHKNRLTAYYRFLSENLRERRSPEIDIVTPPPARPQPALRPLTPAPVPGRTPAVLKSPTAPIEEDGEDDSDKVESNVTVEELLGIISSENQKAALKEQCASVAADDCADKETLAEKMRTLAVLAKAKGVEHYQLRLIVQMLCVRKQLEDEDRDTLIGAVDDVMFADDADEDQTDDMDGMQPRLRKKDSPAD